MSGPHTPTRSQSVSARESMTTLDSSKIRKNNSIHSVGNFIIDKTLAEKDSAKVCLARHKKTKKLLALKFIRLEGQSESRLARYSKEVTNLSLLHHPHIARLYDAVQTEKYSMLVTEYVTRGDLLNYTCEQGRMNEEEARRLFRQIVSALDYLHANCICHRNLKLENILLDMDKNVKLIGFGRSSVFEWGRLLNTYCGSPHFCSPEMVEGIEYTGPEVDIWSVGVVLFFMLTGSMPFQGEMLQDVYAQIAQGKYKDPEFLSMEARDLFAKIFVVDRARRISLQDIKMHAWVNKGHSAPVDSFLPVRPATVLKPSEITLQGMAAFGHSPDEAKKALGQKHQASTPIVAIYHLLDESRQRSIKKLGQDVAEPLLAAETPAGKTKRGSQLVKVWHTIKLPAAKVKHIFYKQRKE